MLLCLAGACEADPLPLPADVDAVFEESCRRCHGAPTDNFAPMSLVTWDDLIADSPSDRDVPVYQQVARRIHDARFPMPPVRSAEAGGFTDADRAVIDAWIAGGARPAPPPEPAPSLSSPAPGCSECAPRR